MTRVMRYDQSCMSIKVLAHSRVMTAEVSWVRDVSLFLMYATGARSSRYDKNPCFTQSNQG
jgi:hypothetical protein